MKNLSLSIAMLLSILGCTGAKYKSGDCIKANDGYIWHVLNSGSGKYTAQGWQGNSWGNSTELDSSILDRYSKMACPVRK